MNKDIKFCKIQLNTCKEGMKSFVYEDTYITDPTLDETGRYPVDPIKYYGLNNYQLQAMAKANKKRIDAIMPEWKHAGSKL